MKIKPLILHILFFSAFSCLSAQSAVGFQPIPGKSCCYHLWIAVDGLKVGYDKLKLVAMKRKYRPVFDHVSPERGFVFSEPTASGVILVRSGSKMLDTDAEVVYAGEVCFSKKLIGRKIRFRGTFAGGGAMTLKFLSVRVR